MAPSSDASERAATHEDDLIALVARLAEVEYERGRLMATLEFHLRLHHLAQVTAPGEEVETPSSPAPVVSGRPKRWPKGELERAILDVLSTRGSRKPIDISYEVGAAAEVVRHTLGRLRMQGVVLKDDLGRFALPTDAGVE